MPAENQCHAGRKRDGHNLRKLDDINGAEETPQKDLCAYDIDAGNDHHNQQSDNPYPLKKAANAAIKLLKFSQHDALLYLFGRFSNGLSYTKNLYKKSVYGSSPPFTGFTTNGLKNTITITLISEPLILRHAQDERLKFN